MAGKGQEEFLIPKNFTEAKESPGGGGGTSYKWANGDVPLDGVAFSRLA